jgi:hypothetical protein
MPQMTPSPRWCALHEAVGEHEPCPGSSCGLWHDDGCVLESVALELKRAPAVSRHLLGLRTALEGAAEVDLRVRSDFYRRLNEEQAAEA